jgi:hypothetical protein
MSRAQAVVRTALVLSAALGFAGRAGAQAAWEYTPYEVHVRIAVAGAPQLPSTIVPVLGEAIANRSQAIMGAVWQVDSAPAAAKLRSVLLSQGSELNADDIAAVAPAADLTADKLYLVVIEYRQHAYEVSVREFDCRTRQLGEPVASSASALELLSLAIWDAVAESFTPLARIEQVEQNHVVARLRAGGLAIGEGSPVLLEPGTPLRPVVRRNDRSGQPAQGGIQSPPWTVLTVEDREGAVIDCTLQSGYRNPIPARGGVRVERLAMAIRPRHETTRLLLRSRTNPDKPLVGYEVHTRTGEGDETQSLGMTNTRGAFELPRAGGGMQVLYIKSGQQLLARLPVVPGQQATLTAKIVDDDNRLATEGYIAALANRALDLVARREILAARIRGQLKEGKVAEAQKLLDEFRKLQTRADLARDLDQFRRRVATPDSLTQQRIDKLFADVQKLLLLRPLSDELLGELTREVAAKRSASTKVQGREFKVQG